MARFKEKEEVGTCQNVEQHGDEGKSQQDDEKLIAHAATSFATIYNWKVVFPIITYYWRKITNKLIFGHNLASLTFRAF